MTLKDIAEHFSISRTTVSLCLNGKAAEYGLRKELAQQVNEYARAHGYHPNVAGQLLRRKMNNLIGVYLPLFKTGFYAELLSELFRTSQENGYFLLPVQPDQKDDFQMVINRFMDFNVAGAIAVCDNENARQLVECHCPFVLMDRYVLTPELREQCNCVYSDIYDAGYELGKLMIQRGRRKIAYFGPNYGDGRDGDPRCAGFRDAISVAGRCEPIFYPIPECTFANGYNYIVGFLEQHPDIDAIMGHNDLVALGIMRRLNEWNIRVPEQIAVAGFDNIQAADYVVPGLTTVERRIPQLADAAINALLYAISTPLEHLDLKIPCDIVIRKSV